MTGAATGEEPTRPRFRGVTHQYAFFASLITGAVLVFVAPTRKATTAAAIYAASVSGLFGASALYHRPTWPPTVRSWLARLDHAGIYLLIAGTYTPFGLLVFSKGWAIPVLTIVWTGAVAAILLKLFWVRAPKHVAAAIGLVLGWIGVVAFGQLLKLPLAPLLLLLAGGLLYSLGAIIYTRKRPDPIPHVFGYHELFHALTLAAAACQYAAIVFFVLPRA